ncbi:MAG: acyl carrier protein [Candidatus Riflebacteria bacterium]|nr:acyl carrier protein [Candidatus Riflebacteria bacterium]
MEHDDIFPGVRDCLVDALMLKDPERVRPASSLIRDLGADSLDILDLIFHLEERFSIRISKEEINYYSNLGLSEAETHVGGVLTQPALERLRQMMPEAEPSAFASGLTVSEVPKLITVQTLMNLVDRKLAATQGN